MTIRTRRRTRVALSAAATAGLLAPALALAPAHAATACTASDLAASFGDTSGAAGTIYNVMVLKNVSNTACTMRGYPGLARYAKNGRPQATTIVTDISPAPTSITLAPQRKASFIWAYTDVPTGNADDCKNTRVLGVSAPGSSSRLYLATKIPYCAKQLRVSAVAAGVLPAG